MGLFAMSLLRSATRVVLFRRGGSAVCLSPRVGLSLLQSDSPFSGHGLNTRSPFMRQQALISTAKPPSMKPRDTKAAFQQGNVEETITRWEREARVAELNLITEKLGLDRKNTKIFLYKWVISSPSAPSSWVTSTQRQSTPMLSLPPSIEWWASTLLPPTLSNNVFLLVRR